MTELIVLGVILFASILVISQNVDFFFWLTIIFYFDPGGFVEGFLGGKLLSVFNISDVLILLIIYAILMAKNKPRIKDDKDFVRLIKSIVIFQCFYIVIFGIVTPYLNNRLDILFFLLKNRNLFHVIPILIGTYLFAMKDLELFFKILLYTSVTILSLYFITLITGLELIYVYKISRYGESSGLERVTLLSYGFMDWFFPLGLIVYLLRTKLKVKINRYHTIVITGILMLVTLLITLTRRELLSIAAIFIIVPTLISYIFSFSKINNILRISIPALTILLFFTLVSPKKVEDVLTVFTDAVSLSLTGKDTEGRTDYRVSGSGDLEISKQFISENILLGTGYIPWVWADQLQAKRHGDQLAIAQDAANEVPLYGAFMQFGVFGVILMVYLFYNILRKMVLSLKQLKKSRFTQYSTVDSIILLYLLVFLISSFTVRFFDVFSYLYSTSRFVYFGAHLGIFYSLMKSFDKKNYTKND